MDALWASLDLLMVALLFFEEGCEVFWAIQFVQCLELIPWLCGWSFQTWMQLDIANVVMELGCIACLRRMPLVWALMVAHVGVKLAIYRNVALCWEYQPSATAGVINKLTLLAILAYTLRTPTLRVIGRYAKHSSRSARNPAETATSPA